MILEFQVHGIHRLDRIESHERKQIDEEILYQLNAGLLWIKKKDRVWHKVHVDPLQKALNER